MTASDRVAVITIVHERHAHLARQLWGLARQTREPDLLVVVAMDDPEVEAVVRRGAAIDGAVDVVSLSRRRGLLPLAAARNEGACVAMSRGADVLVFLDVDCIPSEVLVERYAAVLTHGPDGPQDWGPGPVVACGEVAYLPPIAADGDYRDRDLPAISRAHPARPVLAPGQLALAEDLRLFWSLSFAVTARDWARIGGFDDAYLGYGGEDTDFGQRLGAAGGRMLWVGGAQAFHQHHETASPPVQHVREIVDNANLFAERWGWWPMEGWLAAFEERGLAHRLANGAWAVGSA